MVPFGRFKWDLLSTDGISEPLEAIYMIKRQVIEQLSINCPSCSKNDQNGPWGVPLRAPRVPFEPFKEGPALHT